MAAPADDGYWNHNVHYQRVILDALPARCGPAVDVGCGDGLLVRKLAARCGPVTGIDRDAAMIALARARPVPGAVFVEDDFLACPLPGASFDFACANTALHHMGTAAALEKLARILRPGGRLAVVGIAANGSLSDWVTGAAGLPVNLWYRRTRGEAYTPAPVLPPDLTWAQARETARRVLPGVRYRKHLLWRYSLIWDKPA